AHSTARPGARKLALMLTDGLPTFPVGLGSESDPGDVDAALAAANVARRAGIAINTYALGPSALTNPFAATEISRITLGTFLPVQNPGDIVSFLQGTSIANTSSAAARTSARSCRSRAGAKSRPRRRARRTDASAPSSALDRYSADPSTPTRSLSYSAAAMTPTCSRSPARSARNSLAAPG